MVGTTSVAEAASAEFRLCNTTTAYKVRVEVDGHNTDWTVAGAACVTTQASTGTQFVLRIRKEQGNKFEERVGARGTTEAAGNTAVNTFNDFDSFKYDQARY
ncbi:hypothetical protein [Amycolatopsis ultiminotia]